jgi:hypothetical protein
VPILAAGVKRAALCGAAVGLSIAVTIADIPLATEARVQVVELHLESGAGVAVSSGHVEREIVPKAPGAHVAPRPEHARCGPRKVDVLRAWE